MHSDNSVIGLTLVLRSHLANNLPIQLRNVRLTRSRSETTSRDGQRSDPVDLAKTYLTTRRGHGVVADTEAGS